jgi:amidase
MARTVKDAAHILQAIAGVDPYDNYTSAIPNNGVLPDYVAACNLSAFGGARIGIPRNILSLLSDNTTVPLISAFEKAIATIKAAGATIVDNTNFTGADEFFTSSAETLVLNADFIVNLANYLNVLTFNPNNVTSLADIRNFTHANPLEDWPDRNTAIWDQALQGWNNTDPRFWVSYQNDQYFGGAGGLLGALSNHSLDAVILPTSFASSWAAIVGAPIVTVPLGFYPTTTPVKMNQRGNLVANGPNIPYVARYSTSNEVTDHILALV